MPGLEPRLRAAERIQDQREEQAGEKSLVRLTGLWLGETKAGDKYLSGTVSPSSKLLILTNRHKDKETDPDYIAYLAPADRPEQAKRGGL